MPGDDLLVGLTWCYTRSYCERTVKDRDLPLLFRHLQYGSGRARRTQLG